MSLSVVAGLRAGEEMRAAEESSAGFGPPLGAFPPPGARRVRFVSLSSLNGRCAGGIR